VIFKNSKGFTLLELTLVISLLILTVGVSGTIILTLVRNYTQTQLVSELEQTSNFIIAKIKDDVRPSLRIVFPEAPGDSADTLIIQGLDASRNPYCIYYYVDDSTGILYRDYFEGNCLTISPYIPDFNPEALIDVDAVKRVFANCTTANSCFVNSSQGEVGLVDFNIQFSTSNIDVNSNDIVFDDVIVLRGSYR
jgi:type II secretory pathway pseudopilin PulG